MQNNRARKRNAVIAAIAGASLLIGGSTYALWSATGKIDGGTITAGDLNIVGGVYNMWDVSEDRTDQDHTIETAADAGKGFETIILTGVKGHAIDEPDLWRMVPGDTVAITFPYKITLLGDNMIASLKVPGKNSIIDASNSTPISAANLSFDYQVFLTTQETTPGEPPVTSTTTKSIKARTALDPDDSIVSYFQAPTEGQDDGQIDGDGVDIPVIEASDGSAVVTLVLYVTFNKNAGEGQGHDSREDATNVLQLAESITATLTQVRCDDTNLDDSNFVCTH